MDIKIQPSVIGGEVKVPASKSYSHRVVIAASLANGTSVIENLQLSEDIQTTIDIMEKFGAKIKIQGEDIIVKGTGGK